MIPRKGKRERSGDEGEQVAVLGEVVEVVRPAVTPKSVGAASVGNLNDSGASSIVRDKREGDKREESLPDPVSPLALALGYQFSNRNLLEQALTHRSVQGVFADIGGTAKGGDYERLEFLGDAVLDLAIGHLLYEQHPEALEGELSKMRSALVNSKSLAAIARELNIGPYIRLSRGESACGGADRESILADVVEALFGAIYYEAGFDKAFEVVKRVWGAQLASVLPSDPKTELQEQAHILGVPSPEYSLEGTEGPDHNPTFVSTVRVGHDIVGRGRGPTKKLSQKAAAAEALQIIATRNQKLSGERRG